MKIFSAVFLSVMIVSSSTVFAGGHSECPHAAHEKQEKYVEKKMKMLNGKLDLSGDQQKQVETILREKMERKQEIKQKKYEDMQAVSDTFKTKMSGVLDADQKEKFDSMMEKYSKKSHKKKKKFLIF